LAWTRAGCRQLVEEKRAVFRQFHQADLAADGAGERAFFMAEEFALEQVVLKAGHVDGDKPPAATAFFVDAAGQHLLADPGFPVEQDGGIRPGHGIYVFKKTPHLR
jgi:hypothetical protein